MVVNDVVFGKMNYDAGWEKREDLFLFGRQISVRIVAAAYTGQEILETQRKAYQIYQKNMEEYIRKIPDILLQYYLDHYEMIEEIMNIPEKINKQNITANIIVRLIEVKAVYFDRDGRFGWLCDCAWDEENGIAVILSGKDPIVAEQDELI